MDKIDYAVRVGDKIELRWKQNDAFLAAERILGAICPASNESPFYGCCFAQLPHSNKAGKKKLFFLGEIEKELPELFFTDLVELSRDFFSWTWYYNVSDADQDAVESLFRLLGNYKRARDITQIELSSALILDWNTGILTIQQWAADDSLDIQPGSILASQLGRMTKEDRSPSRRQLFYAVDALRAIMGHATQNRYWRSYAPEPLNYFFG